MLYSDRTKSLEARLDRVWDIEDCKTLANLMVLYYCNNERARSLDELWVKEPENQSKASYGRNWGYYIGMEAIRKHYVDDTPPMRGHSALRPMTTTACCVADDGKTAYGMWYCVSEETFGAGKAYWISEQIAFDFINENGEWKILHMFVAADMAIPAGRDLRTIDSVLKGGPELPYKEFFTDPTVKFDAFLEYQYAKFPPVPTPHMTYSYENSCCMEANPYYRMLKEEGKL